MAYLVIAIGALMALVGGYLVNYGYAIVQVERGWSSVIAGAVFLTGGLLVIGLGLLLRAIVDVRHSLLAGLAPVGPVAAGLTPAGRPATVPFGSDLPIGPSFGEPSAQPPVDMGPSLAPLAFEAHASEPAPFPPHGADNDIPLASTHDDGAIHFEEAVVAGASSGLPPEHDAEPTHPAAAATVTGASAPVPVEASAPAMDDWLDRAFSDLDGNSRYVDEPRRDVSGVEVVEPLTVERASSFNEPVPTHPHGAIGTDDLMQVEPEAAVAPPRPDLAAVQPPPTEPYDSAVIGRYESDDTSYVMYADGSIEAHSQAGVYRFASMAELKAFIEG